MREFIGTGRQNQKRNSALERLCLAVVCVGVAGCSGPQARPDAAGTAAAPLAEIAPAASAPAADIAPKNEEQQRGSRAEYVDGSGVFIKAPPSAKGVRRAEPPKAGEGLRFRDAPIKTVVDAVLGDVAKVAYAVDPAVQGTISFETSGTLEGDAIIIALEDALRTKSYALVNVGGSYRVVPMQQAPRMSTVRTQSMPNDTGVPGFSVYVLTPKHVAPSQLQKMLEPFAPTGSILRVDDLHDLIIFAGTSEEIEMLLQSADTFDADWISGMSLAFYNVRFVDADTAVSELTKILDQAGDPLAAAVKLIPLPRINKILGIAPKAEQLRRIEAWLERLDIKDAGSGRKVYVYQVQHGRAEDLARALNYILTGQNQNVPGEAGAGGPTNSASYTPGKSAVRSPPTPGTDAGAATFRILPSEETNSLLIWATASEYDLAESAVKQLDVAPRQVLIEASLAEVTLNKDLRFGVQWFTESGDNKITFSSASNGAIASQFPGFSYLYSGNANATAVLNALEGITTVNVISSPKLMVLNNQTATLQVGDEIPVPTQSAVSVQASSAPIVNTIEYRNTGVILTVKPRINDSGLVFLDITQEVSDVSPNTTSGIDAPTINQRKITSTIAVKSGDTITLGGLIRNSTNDSRSGIPFLQRIPVFGNLFTNRNVTGEKTELIVFLTPRVLRNVDEVRDSMSYLQGEFKRIFGAGHGDSHVNVPQ